MIFSHVLPLRHYIDSHRRLTSHGRDGNRLVEHDYVRLMLSSTERYRSVVADDGEKSNHVIAKLISNMYTNVGYLEATNTLVG